MWRVRHREVKIVGFKTRQLPPQAAWQLLFGWHHSLPVTVSYSCRMNQTDTSIMKSKTCPAGSPSPVGVLDLSKTVLLLPIPTEASQFVVGKSHISYFLNCCQVYNVQVLNPLVACCQCWLIHTSPISPDYNLRATFNFIIVPERVPGDDSDQVA